VDLSGRSLDGFVVDDALDDDGTYRARRQPGG
jgi:hypothetical protein